MTTKEHPPITWPLAGLLLLSVLALGGCQQIADSQEVAKLTEKQVDEWWPIPHMTWEEVEPLIDSAWTLDKILADPLGARCNWVWITGTVLPTKEPGYPYPMRDVFYLGQIEPAAGIYKVVQVDGANTVPAAGATVSVVGKFFCTQVWLERAGNDVAAFEEKGHEYRMNAWSMEVT